MIGSVGIVALQEIRSYKGFENAILAGGYVRDSILGGDFSDIDIFVPLTTKSLSALLRDNYEMGWKNNFLNNISNSERESYIAQGYQVEKTEDGWNIKTPEKTRKIGNFTDIYTSDRGYKSFKKGSFEKADCKFLTSIDVDIMGMSWKGKPEHFGEHIVGEFSYHIDMAYFDGQDTITTPKFERDARNKEATLCRLDSLDHLHSAVMKFDKLRNKYPEFIFRTNCLEIKRKGETDREQEE